MKRVIILLIASVAALVNFQTALGSPGTLSLPALYDNTTPGEQYGQLFQSDADYISGIKWYIGDPTRMNDPTVNGLSGAADLVLYDATNYAAPIQLERTQVQDDNGYTFGLTEFDLQTPVLTTIGDMYFLTLDSADEFGLGLTSQTTSTYSGGFEGRIKNGALGEAGSNTRDTSFMVLNQPPVPEPTSLGLMVMLALGSRLRRTRASVGRRLPPGTD